MNVLLQHLSLLMAAPEGAAGSAGGGGQLVTTFITFGLVIGIFYFLIIRPQNKRKKEAQKMIEALKKGDKVTTIGGIRGTVTSVRDDTVVVKVDANTKMEFSKSAVSTVDETASSKKTSTKKKSEAETEESSEETTEGSEETEESDS